MALSDHGNASEGLPVAAWKSASVFVDPDGLRLEGEVAWVSLGQPGRDRHRRFVRCPCLGYSSGPGVDPARSAVDPDELHLVPDDGTRPPSPGSPGPSWPARTPAGPRHVVQTRSGFLRSIKSIQARSRVTERRVGLASPIAPSTSRARSEAASDSFWRPAPCSAIAMLPRVRTSSWAIFASVGLGRKSILAQVTCPAVDSQSLIPSARIVKARGQRVARLGERESELLDRGADPDQLFQDRTGLLERVQALGRSRVLHEKLSMKMFDPGQLAPTTEIGGVGVGQSLGDRACPADGGQGLGLLSDAQEPECDGNVAPCDFVLELRVGSGPRSPGPRTGPGHADASPANPSSSRVAS